MGWETVSPYCFVLLLLMSTTLCSVHGDITETTLTDLPRQAEEKTFRHIANVRNIRSATSSIPVPLPPSIFRGPPDEIIFRRGSRFELPCLAKGYPSPKYRWMQNSEVFTGHKYVEFGKRGTLVFSSGYETDEGRYQCFAKNELGVSVSAVSVVRMTKLSLFDPSSHTVQQGASYTLNCNAYHSVPTANITWVIKKGNNVTEMEPLPSHLAIDEQNRLHFMNVQKEDQQLTGGYACVIENKPAIAPPLTTSHIQYLKVEGPERLNSPTLMYASPSYLVGVVGTAVRMQCIFAGNPTPQVRWVKADGTSSQGNTLEITNVRPEDTGSYKCLVNISVSGKELVSERTFQLLVESRPDFVRRPTNKEVDIGGRAEFKCVAKGVPAPSVIWTINGLPLQDTALKNKRFIQKSASVLAFSNVRIMDSSVIQCNATNKHGSQIAEFYLNVVAPVPKPPSIYRQAQRNVYFREHQPSLSLVCRAHGNPPPRYRWTKNNRPLNSNQSNDNNPTLDNAGTLELAHPDARDEGFYQCFAENKFGVSLSPVFNVRMARSPSFSSSETKTIVAYRGRPLILPCNPPNTIPTGRVYWVYQHLDKHIEIDFKEVSPRISMDQDHRLHFANIRTSDEKIGPDRYACVVKNSHTRYMSQVMAYNLIVQEGDERKRGTNLAYASPSDVIALENESVKLQCIFAGNPAPRVYWEKVGKILETSNTQRNDTGTYRCRGGNSIRGTAGSVVEKVFNVRRGSRQCIFEGNPAPRVYWEKVGASGVEFPPSQILELSNTQRNDTGTYRCRGENGIRSTAGSVVEKVFNVRVGSRPSFVHSLHDVELLSGMQPFVKFICRAAGVPNPDIKWTINGRELNDSALSNEKFVQLSPNELIYHLKEKSRMAIQCNASNIHGYVFSDAYLNTIVFGPELANPSEPRVTAVEGHEVKLGCESKSRFQSVTSWYKDNSRIIFGSRFSISDDGNLTIKDAVLADSGVYRCDVVSSFGRVSGQRTLTIHSSGPSKPPKVNLGPNRNIYFRFSGSFRLECKADGTPPPTYKWKKDGTNLSTNSNQRFQQLNDSGTLLVTGATEMDQGLYQCFAENDIGVSVSVSSEVKMARLMPFRRAPLSNHSVVVGSHLALPCIVPAYVDPLARVTWARTDNSGRGFTEIDFTAVSPRISMDGNNWLQFSNAKKEDDLGQNGYICIVVSAFLRATVTDQVHYVTVIRKKRPTAFHPLKLRYKSRTLDGVSGSDVRIQCLFSGNPTPRYRWQKVGGKLPSRARVVGHGHTLEIRDTLLSDAGHYICTVRKYSDEKKRYIKRRVKFLLNIERAPFFKNKPVDVEVVGGGSAEINCDVNGNPSPQITWTINGLPFQDSALKIKSITHKHDPVLMFTNLTERDSMVVQCKAVNKHGYVFADVYINVVAPPTKPPRVHTHPEPNVYFVPGDKLKLTCQADGNPPTTYRWRKKNAGVVQELTQLNNISTLFITKTNETTEGLYQCLAENELGVSLSRFSYVRMAVPMSFRVRKDVTHRKRVGEPLTLDCDIPRGHPSDEVYWVIARPDYSLKDVNFKELAPRVTMDLEYRLHFINVQKEDELKNEAYRCVGKNNFFRRIRLDRDHHVKVRSYGRGRSQPTMLMYATSPDLLGVAGTLVRMQCIFSGFPTPQHQWKRVGNISLPPQARVVNQGQILEIPDLQTGDAGTYQCIGTNTILGHDYVGVRKVTLRVESRPYFLKEPANVKVAAGGNAELNCDAGGDPTPDIAWTLNGVDLRDVTNKAYVMTSPFKMVFLEVNETDSMVVQCNISNKHGYQLGEVYLEIVGKIPEIVSPPEPRVSAMKGGDVNLKCGSEGKPRPVTTWYKNNVLVSGFRVRVLQDGTLNIKDANVDDSGVYRCDVVNKYGNVSAEGVLEIRSLVPPRIIQQPYREVHFEKDRSFTLQCKADGNPKITYRWRKNGVYFTIDGNERVQKSNDSGTLFFIEATERDQGRYQCLAENELGVSASIVTAVKLFIDFSDQPPVYHKTQVGQSLTLSCDPPVGPIHQVFWVVEYDEFAFEEIEFDEVGPRISMDEDFRLWFTNVEKTDDQGGKGYFCIVKNPYLRKYSRGRINYIQLEALHSTVSLKPEIQSTSLAYRGSSTITGLVGTEVKMQCIFSGYPTPDHYWERNQDKQFSPRTHIRSRGQTLEIIDLQSEDAGEYTCIGHNSGKPVRASYRLIVESQPDFLKSPVSVEVAAGDYAEFTCEAGGIPSPEITWTVNGIDLDDPSLASMNFRQTSASRLVFPNVSESDGCVVQCKASNTHGDLHSNAHLYVLGPRNLRVTNLNLTSMSATAKWEGATEAMNISIQDDQGNHRIELISPFTTQHVITGLQRARSYSVKIIAGSGFESGLVTFKVPALKAKYHTLTSLVLKSKQRTVCLVPKELSGTYVLLDAINDFSIALTTWCTKNRRVVPQELVLKTRRMTSTVDLTGWEYPQHPDFDVSATDLHSLIVENEDVSVSMARLQKRRAMHYSLEIFVKSQRKFSGIIEMLNEAGLQPWHRTEYPPTRKEVQGGAISTTLGGCEQRNADMSLYLTRDMAWIHDSDMLVSGYH